MTGTSDVFVAPVGWRQSSAEATRADDTEQLKQNRGVKIAQENQNEAVRSLQTTYQHCRQAERDPDQDVCVVVHPVLENLAAALKTRK